MGSGASTQDIEAQSDSDLALKFAELYKKNPERMEKVIQEGKQQASSGDTNEISPPPGANTSVSPGGSFEAEVARIMNAARAAPASLVPQLEARLQRYDGKVLRREGKPNLLTEEGAEAVRDCLAYLQGEAQPAGPLELKPGLCRASQDHVDDIGGKGSTSHTGSDGSSMQDRIERHGDWTDLIGENICFAEDAASEVVLSLLIDDAVKSRGHRKNIFNPRFKTVGIAFGPHKNFRHVCVMNFSGDYGPKVEKLATALTVTVDQSRTPAEIENLHKVLASVPFPEIKEKVIEALQNNEITIVLNYKPGSIESRITEGGVTNVLSGTWSTAMQPL